MQAQATRKAAVHFRERSELLDFLLEISEATTSTLDLDQLLASVAEIVNKVIPFDLFAILLYSDRRQDLRIRYAVGHREEVVCNLAIRLGEGITGTAAQTREPILCGDVRSDPRYLNTVDAVNTEMSAPLITRGRLVGVIDVQSTRRDAYNEYDRTLLRLIAGRVAIAIDNARLYRRAERQYRTLKTLANVSHELSSILDLDHLLNRISKTVRGLISYDAFSILLVDEEQKVLRHRFSIRFDQRVNIDNVPLGMGITGAAVESRQPVNVQDTLKDPRYIASHPDVRSEVAVPLTAKDRVIGVMDLESDRVGFFTEEHVRTLAMLAPQIASSVENARLYEELALRERAMEEDLRAAYDLQRVLLPTKAPQVAGLDVAIGLRPAREISGDIYDFFEHRDDHVLLAFGDVSGKGAAAALYGALVSGLLRTLAPSRRDPAELMRAVNEALISRKVDARYVTLLVMLWHPHSRQFTMANAGALPPLACRGGQILKYRVEGIPLGLMETSSYEMTLLPTEPGDVIVLFSDGVTDHMSADDQEYGRRRLGEVLKRSCELGPQEIVAEIFADLDRFATKRFDDQTVIVLKVK